MPAGGFHDNALIRQRAEEVLAEVMHFGHTRASLMGAPLAAGRQKLTRAFAAFDVKDYYAKHVPDASEFCSTAISARSLRVTLPTTAGTVDPGDFLYG